MSELLVNGRPVDYGSCPVSYMADGLRLYFEHGILPGSFMTAVLSNDLMDACGMADSTNRHNIFEWAAWLYNYAPSGSFGSREAVESWIKSRQPKDTTS